MQRMSETGPVKTELEMILAAVHSTIMAEPYCFLITLDESGQPQARMVGAARVEPNFQIRIITSPKTRKAREIQRERRATMAFSDNRGEGYVTLIGQARLDNDVERERERERERKRKKALWKTQYEAFYPEGPEGKDSVLVEFTPHQIEIMHFHLKVGIWPWTSEPTILVRDGSSWRKKTL